MHSSCALSGLAQTRTKLSAEFSARPSSRSPWRGFVQTSYRLSCEIRRLNTL
ncbi:unnamed protein product [Symbiodinium necroappetens]|uniref:Uncharacterized protein n=1 Tax=Symbiodinium necroappetens TaxID=1628268 RepID=A0A812NS00_9DINO|nr:unnamed protein product [Symbiodinium necroappetens]CAE7501449.1 unnamed protein product [Symbiodinium sp. KB8]CAE7907686.1 unnamed protein product [Symbiodinium microadriaticum]